MARTSRIRSLARSSSNGGSIRSEAPRVAFFAKLASESAEQRRTRMTDGMTRREFAMTVGAASIAALGFGGRSKAADAKTLRFIPQTDVQVLDPIWTTAYVTRNHGYMVFDTLFAIDSKFKPHPQMVDGYEVSPDKLNYSFVLRNGLKFHDGQPVRGADCVASIKRWMARDALGQTMATVIADMKGGGGKNFSIDLKEPLPLLIDGLAKVSSLGPFIV